MRLQARMALLTAALLLPAQAGAENYRWDSVAIGGGGYVTGIITSKTERGVIYARTDVGGAYRWDPAQARWLALMDWVSDDATGLLGIESLAVDPADAAKVYMLAGTSYFNNGKTAVLRSTDYGKTFAITDVTSQFKAHGNGMGRQSGEKLQVDPGSGNVLYLGTRRDGLFKSTDAGASWNRMASLDVRATPNDNGISFVLLDPTSVDGGVATRMFVGVSRQDSAGPNLYFSYDAGESFIPVEGGPAGLMPQRAVMTQEGKLYLTYANGAGPHPDNAEALDRGQVWEYDAVGGNWTEITPSGFTRPFGGISLDPNNPRRLVLSTINNWLPQAQAYGDRIFTSTDAGRSWTDVIARGYAMDTKGIGWIADKAIHWAGSIEFDPFDSGSVLVASGNGIFRNANIDAPAATWDFHVAGLEETVPLNAISIAGGPLVTAIGDYDGFLHTDPAQYGAIHSPQMGTTTGLAVATLDPRQMARVGNAMYYSTNGGASWTKTAQINGAKGQLAMAADGAVLLHSPADSATTYRSVNYGAGWTPVTGLAINNARPVADPVNPFKFYAYDTVAGRMMVSTDGGASFSARATLPSGGYSLIRTAPEREGDVWACADGLTRSTDSGATFTKVASVNNCTAVGFGKAAPGANYPAIYLRGTVGTVRGVLRSIDGGATWTRVNDAAHEFGGTANGQFVLGDMNSYGMVYMSTAGRGIAYGKPDETGDVPVTPVTPGTPPPQPVNQCAYVVTAAWQGGYNAAIRITNNRNTVINGWTVNWTYSDNSEVQGSWNAAVTGTKPNYSATNNQSWNTDIWPGATVEFGLTVSGAAIPTVTGAVCN